MIQATMEVALRDPTLRGKRVFECRNGSYVMFIAEVDFVPDIMMKLARKEIMDSGGRGGGDSGGCCGGAGTVAASGSLARSDDSPLFLRPPFILVLPYLNLA